MCCHLQYLTNLKWFVFKCLFFYRIIYLTFSCSIGYFLQHYITFNLMHALHFRQILQKPQNFFTRRPGREHSLKKSLYLYQIHGKMVQESHQQRLDRLYNLQTLLFLGPDQHTEIILSQEHMLVVVNQEFIFKWRRMSFLIPLRNLWWDLLVNAFDIK